LAKRAWLSVETAKTRDRQSRIVGKNLMEIILFLRYNYKW